MVYPDSNSSLRQRDATAAARGFTLIELLIVVSILGILAGVTVPHFTSPISDSKEAALLFTLTELCTLIESYRAQHDPAWPVVFGTQLLIRTDASGLPGTRYGPYLRRGFPANPVSENALVK
jgi:prepilin-type N-terminal cleavage/methylation domain-containing protein